MTNKLSYISRVVQVGDVPLGGTFPIRIQSMTSTPTLDTEKTVAQSIRMIEAGCEYVRITAPFEKEAQHLAVIKKELKKRGYTTPLIADVHYKPQVAEIAARIVEKVRINPGNYIDRKIGRTNYTEAEFNSETEKIRERIKPLISICKEYGTALRIGINHGSLSERFLLKFGDTPLGMVESAMEFLKICENLDYRNIVVSMKSSNVKVMVQANRLLVRRMLEEGMNYPLHLGVTEAGDAEDGRIKSAAGIGPLLEDGIGDTIRVSLTEDPEYEIPVARTIVAKFNKNGKRAETFIGDTQENPIHPFSFQRRETKPVASIGGGQSPVVITDQNFRDEDFDQQWTPDFIYTGMDILSPIKNLQEKIPFDLIKSSSLHKVQSNFSNLLIVLEPEDNVSNRQVRKYINELIRKKIDLPVILRKNYRELLDDEFLVNAASDCAYLLVDGLIDGIWLESDTIPPKTLSKTAFDILQATGSRISKTEYIACPSCGRTLFNIQQTLKTIKSQTGHLKGLKIAVMGCCVNGPGEMADADYGYVGAGRGKITLYKGSKIMKTGIPERLAVHSLIRLIKENNDW